MKEFGIFDRLPAKFCGMVEEYRLRLVEKNGLDMQLDVSLSGTTICGIHETVLISKKFGFIKWLVENDKIDLDEKVISCLGTKSTPETMDGKIVPMYYSDYKSLLMLLSIQDNPIDFLISILKIS